VFTAQCERVWTGGCKRTCVCLGVGVGGLNVREMSGVSVRVSEGE